MTCPACNGVGWLLSDRHAGHGNSSGPVSLDLLPCLYPTCTEEPRPIATLGILGQFTEVVRHPLTDEVIALTGFTKPNYR